MKKVKIFMKKVKIFMKKLKFSSKKPNIYQKKTLTYISTKRLSLETHFYLGCINIRINVRCHEASMAKWVTLRFEGRRSKVRSPSL